MATTILVSAAGRRRYVLEALANSAGPSDTLYATDLNPAAPGLFVPGVKQHVCRETTNDARDDWMLEFCKTNDVDAVLSLHDYEAIRIARMQDALLAAGTLLIGPDLRTANILIDKLAQANSMAEHAPELAIPTIRGEAPLESLFDVPTALQTAKRWVVKDRFGSASSGLTFADSPGAVSAAVAANARRRGWHPTLGSAPVESVVQPMIEATEFNVDLFLDSNYEVVGNCVKRKLRMRGGETDMAEILPNPPSAVLDAAERTVRHLNIRGNVDLDILLDPTGRAMTLDINPRFGGGYAFSCLAGYEAAKGVWDLAARRSICTRLEPNRAFVAAKYISVAEVTSPPTEWPDETSGTAK